MGGGGYGSLVHVAAAGKFPIERCESGNVCVVVCVESLRISHVFRRLQKQQDSLGFAGKPYKQGLYC